MPQHSIRGIAADSLVRLAGEVVDASWSDAVEAELATRLCASTDEHAALLLERHLDGSGRVDLSLFGWQGDPTLTAFQVGGHTIETAAVLGTEVDITDAISEMGVFASTTTACPPVIDGLAPPIIVGRSRRLPGTTRCVIRLPDENALRVASEATRPFADLPWEAGSAWLTEGSRIRLAVDVDASGALVRHAAGLELFDEWPVASRLAALAACAIPQGQLAEAELLWSRLPRVHEVGIRPDRMPGTRLVLGKAQAQHAHVKVTSSQDSGLQAKAYVLSQWISATTTAGEAHD